MYSISQWCGRFGNNIQQISNAIFYCMERNLIFDSPDNELIKEFRLEFGSEDCHSGLFYFHVPSKLGSGIPDFEIENIEKLSQMRREICKNYIYTNLKINHNNIPKLPEDTVIIHIRSGDIFSRKDYYCPVVSSYLQNPLSYYLRISEMYKKVLVLTEDSNNPVVEVLQKNTNTEIKILDVFETVKIMLGSSNIATSGVSSFGIACALLSQNLKKLYCSNLFIQEILNYKDLENSDIEIDLTNIDQERYIKWDDWRNTDEQRKLMIEYVL